MLLPENVRQLAVRDLYVWGTRKNGVVAWRRLIRRLRILFIIRRTKAKPEARLAQMVIILQAETYTRATGPMLIERLEAQLAATEDPEIQNLFAKYLSEP
jgi:hypothetical protein